MLKYIEKNDQAIVVLLHLIPIEKIAQNLRIFQSIEDFRLKQQEVKRAFEVLKTINFQESIKLLDAVPDSKVYIVIDEIKRIGYQNEKAILLLLSIKDRSSRITVLDLLSYDHNHRKESIQLISQLPQEWAEAKDSVLENYFNGHRFFASEDLNDLGELIDIANLASNPTIRDKMLKIIEKNVQEKTHNWWWLDHVDLKSALELIRKVDDRNSKAQFFLEVWNLFDQFDKVGQSHVMALLLYLITQKVFEEKWFLVRSPPAMQETLKYQFHFLPLIKVDGEFKPEDLLSEDAIDFYIRAGYFPIIRNRYDTKSYKEAFVEKQHHRNQHDKFIAGKKCGNNYKEESTNAREELHNHMPNWLFNQLEKEIKIGNNLQNGHLDLIRGWKTLHDKIDFAFHAIFRISDINWKKQIFINLLERLRPFSKDQIDKIQIVFGYLIDNYHILAKDLIDAVRDPSLKKVLCDLHESTKYKGVPISKLLKISENDIKSFLKTFTYSDKIYGFGDYNEKAVQKLFEQIDVANKYNDERKDIDICKKISAQINDIDTECEKKLKELDNECMVELKNIADEYIDQRNELKLKFNKQILELSNIYEQTSNECRKILYHIMQSIRGSDTDFNLGWWLSIVKDLDQALAVIEKIHDMNWKQIFLSDLLRKLFWYEKSSAETDNCLKTQHLQRKLFLVTEERWYEILNIVKSTFGSYINVRSEDYFRNAVFKSKMDKSCALEDAKNGKMSFRLCEELSEEDIDDVINVYFHSLKPKKISFETFNSWGSYYNLLDSSLSDCRKIVSAILDYAAYTKFCGGYTIDFRFKGLQPRLDRRLLNNYFLSLELSTDQIKKQLDEFLAPNASPEKLIMVKKKALKLELLNTYNELVGFDSNNPLMKPFDISILYINVMDDAALGKLDEDYLAGLLKKRVEQISAEVRLEIKDAIRECGSDPYPAYLKKPIREFMKPREAPPANGINPPIWGLNLLKDHSPMYHYSVIRLSEFDQSCSVGEIEEQFGILFIQQPNHDS